MKKLFAVALTLILALGSMTALADEIVMGTNAGFAPFEFIGDDGKPAGFDIEIAKLIAADLGVDLKIEDIYFDGLLAALEGGQIDFIIAAMTITEERKLSANFSTPYFNATQSVIVLKGYEGIATVEDIADKKVAVQDGTTGFFMASDELANPANVSAFKASTDTILELQSGRVDCIIIDDAVAQNFLKLYDDLVIIEGLDMPVEEYGIAVAMGNDDLLASINATLAKIMEDGTYDALITAFFNED